MDITLNDVLTILDEHYNNVKVLEVLNQGLFQLWRVDKETVSDWCIFLLMHLQVLATSFPDHFPPDHVAELKADHFLWQTSQVIKSNGSLPKDGSTGKDVLRLPKGPPGRLRRKIL